MKFFYFAIEDNPILAEIVKNKEKVARIITYRGAKFFHIEDRKLITSYCALLVSLEYKKESKSGKTLYFYRDISKSPEHMPNFLCKLNLHHVMVHYDDVRRGPNVKTGVFRTSNYKVDIGKVRTEGDKIYLSIAITAPSLAEADEGYQKVVNGR